MRARILVVFRVRIGLIQPERILGAHQLGIGPAELAVRAVIMNVPRELLADDADDERFVLTGELPYARRVVSSRDERPTDSAGARAMERLADTGCRVVRDARLATAVRVRGNDAHRYRFETPASGSRTMTDASDTRGGSSSWMRLKNYRC